MDIMTILGLILLLAFFVMMHSISIVNIGKFKVLSESPWPSPIAPSTREPSAINNPQLSSANQ